LKADIFSTALENIDDKYINEAIVYSDTKVISNFRKHHSATVIIAAAVVIILSIAAGAAALIQWNDELREYLGISFADTEQLSEAIVEIGESQIKDGITVTVEQVFGDTHTVYIVASVTFPEEVPLDCKTTIRPIIENVDGGYNFDCVSIDEETRRQTYIINIHSSNKNLIGKNIGLEFIGFRSISDHIKYSSETWEFSFRINYNDLSENITLNASVEDFFVKSMWVSPASVILYIDDLPKELRKIDDFNIIMKDGSSPEIIKYQIVGDIPNGDITPIYGMFPQIIDPSEIKSISVNGIEINIDQYK